MQMTIDSISLCDNAQELLAELSECAEDFLRQVGRMAAIVRRLDELGVQVAIENSLLPYIRLIAHGQLSANLFVACSGDSALLEKAMRLPLPLQEQVAENEPMKVLGSGGDHRMVRPLDMTPRERRQVFYGKRLRTDAEQIGFIRERVESEKAKRAVESNETAVLVDRKRGGIVVKGHFMPTTELARYISELSRK